MDATSETVQGGGGMNPNDRNKLKEEADKLLEEIEKSWKIDYMFLVSCGIFGIAVAVIGILIFICGGAG